MKSRINELIDVETKWMKLGGKPETMTLLFLVPLVQVAWAEGFVQRAERKTVLRSAADLKITQETAGYTDLLNWLEERPSDEFFAEATGLLNCWLDLMPSAQSKSFRNILHIRCHEVARSSTDIGLHPKSESIRREEREQISSLGDRLGFASDPVCWEKQNSFSEFV